MPVNKVELLAKWYLRFNGYFLVDNFTVHPDTKKGKEAEADFLAVRFPFSTEEPGQYCFRRDENLILNDGFDFLIVESKTGLADLNPSWREGERNNVQYAIRWMGFTADEEEIDQLANDLYNTGSATSGDFSLRIVVICSSKNDDLLNKFPELTQITLQQVVSFVHERLMTGCARLQRDNWDDYIQEFAKRAETGETVEEILAWTRETIN